MTYLPLKIPSFQQLLRVRLRITQNTQTCHLEKQRYNFRDFLNLTHETTVARLPGAHKWMNGNALTQLPMQISPIENTGCRPYHDRLGRVYNICIRFWLSLEQADYRFACHR